MNYRKFAGILWLFAILLAAAATFAEAPTRTLYVAVAPADPAGPSAVQVYDVNSRGALTERAIHETGGLARTNTSTQGMIVDQRRRLLFVANNESASIAVFRIQSDGNLVALPGSPYPTDDDPVFLALQPPGDRLFAVQLNGIRSYRVNSDGSLSMGSLTPNFAARELRIDSAGRNLYAADIVDGVRAYRISPSGELAEQTGSPYRMTDSQTQGRPFYLELIQDRTVVALDVDAGFGVWTRDRFGALDSVPDMPFSVGDFSGPFVTTADGRFTYVSVPFEAELRGFSRRDDGGMALLASSPFPGAYIAAALIAPPTLPFLYEVSADLQQVQQFLIEADGTLTEFGTFPVAGERKPNGAAFYQGRWPGLSRPGQTDLPRFQKPTRDRP